MLERKYPPYLEAPEDGPDPEQDQDTSDEENERDPDVIDGIARDVTDETPPMTIERAYSMKNSEGVNYGDISVKGLESMKEKLEQALDELDGRDDDFTLYYDYKERLAAIEVLQQAKADGSI